MLLLKKVKNFIVRYLKYNIQFLKFKLINKFNLIFFYKQIEQINVCLNYYCEKNRMDLSLYKNFNLYNNAKETILAEKKVQNEEIIIEFFTKQYIAYQNIKLGKKIRYAAFMEYYLRQFEKEGFYLQLIQILNSILYWMRELETIRDIYPNLLTKRELELDIVVEYKIFLEYKENFFYLMQNKERIDTFDLERRDRFFVKPFLLYFHSFNTVEQDIELMDIYIKNFFDIKVTYLDFMVNRRFYNKQ